MRKLSGTILGGILFNLLLCNLTFPVYAEDICSEEATADLTKAYFQFPNSTIDGLDYKLEKGEPLGAIQDEYLNAERTQLADVFTITLDRAIKGNQQLEAPDNLKVKARNGPEYELRPGISFDYTLPAIASGYQVDLPAGTKVKSLEGSNPIQYSLDQDVEVNITPPDNLQVNIEIPAGWIIERIPGTGSTGTTLELEPKRAPEGGYITLTIAKSDFDFRDARFSVCLKMQGENAGPIPSEDIELVNIQSDKAELRVRIPDTGESGVYLAKNFDLHLVARGGENKLAEAVSKELKLPSKGTAILSWLVAFALALILMCVITGKDEAGNRKWNPIWIITDKYGRANLSLAQILLWTLLVFSASFYVLVLSGKLLALTGDVLTLLGIAGGASILAKKASEKDRDGRGIAEVLERKTNSSFKLVRKPKLRDLFETEGGQTDLLKIQMALFTALAAVFVTLRIYWELEFPELPAGLLTLMGISNGVYLGAKTITKTDFKDLMDSNKEFHMERAYLKKCMDALEIASGEQNEAERKKNNAENRLKRVEDALKNPTDPDRTKRLLIERDLRKRDLEEATVRFNQAVQRSSQASNTVIAATEKVTDLEEQMERLKEKALISDGYK